MTPKDDTLSALTIAAERADWMQVVLNQGPPCFHLESGGNFCLRAQRWAGHTDKNEYPEHRFVSLADLIESALAQQAERIRELHQALVKVRAHTSYTNPSVELLTGLLASIERIVDAALLTPEGGKGE